MINSNLSENTVNLETLLHFMSYFFYIGTY